MYFWPQLILIKMFTRLYHFAVFILLLISIACKPTAKIQVLQPADLLIPEHIHKIVLIDRSKPSGGFLSNIESVLTGEDYQQDKQGRRRTMEGLSDVLRKTPRFETIFSNEELEGSRGGRSYMPPLSWREVEELCRKYGGDALVSIEMFDSDIQSNITSRIIKEKDKNGKEISRIIYDGRREGTVNLGWRFYDPKTKSIIDEYKDTDRDQVTSSGAISQQAAMQSMRRSYEMVRDIGNKLGAKYGKRIAPTWITLSRSYYKEIKGSNKERFEQAARYADAGEWLKAVAIWEKIAGTRSDADAAGKATYNLAVAAEVNGQLNTALQHAKDAYTQFKDKKAKSYIRILEQRIEDLEVTNRQMHLQKTS